MKRLRRLLLLSSLLLSESITFACGFNPQPHEYRFWILNPGIMHNTALAPFYFGSYYSFYGNFTIPLSEKVHYDENVQQWYDYLHGAVDKKAIYEAQYAIEGMDYLGNEDSLATVNAFVKLLQQKKYATENAYFTLAKQAESGLNYDPWGNNRYTDQSEELVKSRKHDLEGAEKKYKAAKNKFLKSRTAYQMIRLCLDAHLYARGKEIYAQQFLPNADKHSWLYGSGMYYTTLLTDSFTLADYYTLSKIYDITPNKKSACIRIFPSDSTDKILPYAKNDHERAVIYTIKEIQSGGRSLDNMERIYRIDPANEDLPFLVTRETSKLEDWLKTPEFTKYDLTPATIDWDDASRYDNPLKLRQSFAAHHKEDSLYLLRLHSFIDKMIAGGKQKNLAALHLCAAHLSLLNGAIADAEKHIAAMPDGQPKEITFMAEVEKLLINTVAKFQFDQQEQERYLHIMQTPDSLLPVESPAMTKDQLTLFIGQTLLKKGDTLHAILLLGKTERTIGINPVNGYEDAYTWLPDIGSPRLYEQMRQLFSKKNKTAFETFITRERILNPYSYYDELYNGDTTGGHRWNKEALLDFEATYYVNNDNLEQALKIMDKIPDIYWNQEPFVSYMTGDPFCIKVTGVKDPYNILRPSGVKAITKPEYVKRLLALKQSLNTVKGDAKALVALRIAAAYYQMSYHGEYWMMNRIYWSRNEDFKGDNAFDDMYYGCGKAREWYLKALEYARNEKTASIAAILARHCDRLHGYYEAALTAPNRWDVAYTATDRIKPMLERRYARHPYYDMIVQECP